MQSISQFSTQEELYTALYRDTDYGAEFLVRDRADRHLNFLLQHAPPPLLALDVGCGTGVLLRKLIAHGYTACGTEIVPYLLANDLVGLAVRLLRCEDLKEIQDKSHDIVIANDVLEHLPDVDTVKRAIADLARISRKWLLVSCGMHSSKCLAWKNVQLHPVQRKSEWWQAELERYIDVIFHTEAGGSCYLFGYRKEPENRAA